MRLANSNCIEFKQLQIFKNQMSYTTLQDYKIQRKYREEKRKQYLNLFEKLKQNLARPTQPKPIGHHAPSQVKNFQDNDQQLLIQQNNQLRQEVAEIERSEKQKILKFKEQMETAKNQYFGKLKELKQLETTSKNQTQSKINKMLEQIKAASQKNEEISQYNKAVQLQCNQAHQLMEKYSEEIKSQYDAKLEEFSKIFATSSEKIAAIQDQYNEDEFVTSTLQNQQLINSIKENVDKAGDDVDKIIEDYGELLKGKSEILTQLKENNDMKQEQIMKMSALEQKLKTICEKLGEEKKIYLDENKKIAEELIEIKELLTKAMTSES